MRIARASGVRMTAGSTIVARVTVAKEIGVRVSFAKVIGDKAAAARQTIDTGPNVGFVIPKFK